MTPEECHNLSYIQVIFHPESSIIASYFLHMFWTSIVFLHRCQMLIALMAEHHVVRTEQNINLLVTAIDRKDILSASSIYDSHLQLYTMQLK